jgi:hypothetical protein
VNETTPGIERPPLTLTEKHADLLQTIAQKESLCLDLRSQLAIHEEELLQLKRQWEQIVNRGFHFPSPHPGQRTGAVLGGIKEGYHGVGRLLAAGLSMADQSTPASPSSTTRRPRITHALTDSNSSVSTNTTTTTPKSIRFSQSSFSSIGEEEVTSSPREAKEHQVLMAETKRQSGARETEFGSSGCGDKGSKIRRRMSREIDDDDVMQVSAKSTVSTPEESPLQKPNRSKRASLNGSGFPPVSSIPGLGSLAIGSSPVVSAWMGSVEKKWEELQRNPSFAKNQKRASILLSDVSQSLLSTSLSFTSARANTPSQSLLDDDTGCNLPSSVMTPLVQPMQPTKPSAPELSPQTSTVGEGNGKIVESDKEWNW